MYQNTYIHDVKKPTITKIQMKDTKKVPIMLSNIKEVICGGDDRKIYAQTEK